VLVDAELAELLRERPDDYRLRRTRRTSVKGYEHLEPWALKRPHTRGDDGRH
jgi:adenylate cyclase